MRRALAIYEKSFGPEHPNSKIGRGNLEILLTAMPAGGTGQPVEAPDEE